MNARRATAVGGAALLAVLTTLARPAAAAEERWYEDGALPPRDCWICEGGGAARTATTFTALPELPLVPLWACSSKGSVIGEVLVWKDQVLVEVDEGRGIRSLLVLDRETGREILRRPFSSDRSLALAVFQGRVVVRAEPTELQAFEVSASGASLRWTLHGRAEFGRPLLVGGELYVREGGALCRYRATSSVQEVWRVEGHFVGAPSLRAAEVYAVLVDERSHAFLVELDRGTGAEVCRSPLGHLGGRTVPSDVATAPCVFDDQVFVRHSVGVVDSSGAPRNTSLVRREPREDGPARLGSAVLLDLVGDVVPFDGGWLGRAALEGRRIGVVHGTARGIEVLADDTLHGKLLDPRIGLVRSGGTVSFGLQRVEEATRRLLGPTPSVELEGRVVPARDRVLVRGRDGVLRAFGAADRGPRPARFVDPSVGRAVRADRAIVGRAFARDGHAYEGEFRFRPGLDPSSAAGPSELRGPGGTKQHFAAGSLVWLETRDGVLLWAGAREDGAEAIERAVLRLEATAFAERALSAAREGDPGSARLLRDAAVHRELEDAASQDALEEALAGTSVRAARGLLARRAEAEVRALATAFLWRRVESLPAGVDPVLGDALVGALLRKDPAHRGALELVRHALPAAPAVAAAPSTAAPSLELLAVHRRWPLEWLPPAPGEGTEPTLRSPRLDLRAAPSTSPTQLARCIERGERLCEVLESVVPGAPRGSSGERHRLQVFDSFPAYARAMSDSQMQPEWTAGFYSPRERVARVLVQDDPDAFRAMLRVLSHELTHQWCYERWAEVPARPSQHTPGFWVVEGTATLAESWLSEGAEGSGAAAPLECLELVATVDPALLLDWDGVLSMDQDRFLRLGHEELGLLPLPSFLGKGRLLTRTTLFYAQAAAVCHLLHEGPEPSTRAALWNYLRDHLGGRSDRLDVERVFGASAEAIGERTLAHARRRVDRPLR